MNVVAKVRFLFETTKKNKFFLMNPCKYGYLYLYLQRRLIKSIHYIHTEDCLSFQKVRKTLSKQDGRQSYPYGRDNGGVCALKVKGCELTWIE